MKAGSRQIRVTCKACGYDKVRTLRAGDARTLETLRASLRCGDCRVWAKSGSVSIQLVSRDEDAKRAESGRSADAKPGDKIPPAPRAVHLRAKCIVCGNSSVFHQKWRTADTLESLARNLACQQCGAEGSTHNIQVRFVSAAEALRARENKWRDLRSAALTILLLPLAALGGLTAGSIRLAGDFVEHELEDLWRPLLVGAAALAGVAAFAGGLLLTVFLLGAGVTRYGQLVVDAAAYEYQDAVRNSPAGGYRERLQSAKASTPKQMDYYNRRAIGED